MPQDWLPSFGTVDWDAAFGWLHEKTESTLAPGQGEAMQLALTHKVAVLTGGPSCGKSFNFRSIVLLARAKRAKALLTAPTGRAAKRLAELTEMPGVRASALQRLLQLRPGEEEAYDREHPLEADRVAVDEASMLDLLLAITLVNAILPGAHLLFVGDVDQLPSVGAGDVLRDLLGLDAVPSVRLTHIFRQAHHSSVVTNAHCINAGHLPLTRGLGDFFLFAEADAECLAEFTIDIVANRLRVRFGVDARRGVQVLCPMHRGRLEQASSTSGPVYESPSDAMAGGYTGSATR